MNFISRSSSYADHSAHFHNGRDQRKSTNSPQKLWTSLDSMKWDRRAGGEWSTRSTLVAGMTVTFFGEYREIDKPKRVTRTFSLDQLGTSWANDPATGLIGMLMTQRVGYYAAATPFVEFWGPANAAV